MALPVYILAGGHSGRFGSDKARAPLEGRTLLEHVAGWLAPLADRVTVVASQVDLYDDLGFRTIADELPDRGPLGGLARALNDLQPGEDRLLLAPCDLLGVRIEWLRGLLDSAEEAPAAAFRATDGRWQPLPALFSRGVGQRVREHLDQGRLALWRVLAVVGAAEVPLPAGWQEQVGQINTPGDLAAFVRGRE